MALSLLTENKTGGGEGSPSVTLADPALGPRPTGAEPESFGAAPVEGRPPWPVVFGALILCVVSVMLGAQGAVIAEMMKENCYTLKLNVAGNRLSREGGIAMCSILAVSVVCF